MHSLPSFHCVMHCLAGLRPGRRGHSGYASHNALLYFLRNNMNQRANHCIIASNPAHHIFLRIIQCIHPTLYNINALSIALPTALSNTLPMHHSLHYPLHPTLTLTYLHYPLHYPLHRGRGGSECVFRRRQPQAHPPPEGPKHRFVKLRY